MDSNHYFELKIKSVDAGVEDLLVHDLFEIGASGVQENLLFSQKDKKFMPEVIEQNSKDLIAYFESKPSADLVEKLLAQYPTLEFEINEMPIKDWLAEWKASWSPFELVDSFWVVPDWERESFNKEGVTGIFIEPGMAFGTGTHATTQLASSLIQQVCRGHRVQSAVDVGTGSGILTLLLSKLDVSNLWAYDNDPESERVFLENLQKNEAKAHWEAEWQNTLNGKVDLCVANIIDGVLLELKEAFKSLKASHYIFTGILEEREKAFLQEMTEAWDLQLITRLQKEEWVGFLFAGEK